MPSYDYRCPECETIVTIRHSIHDTDPRRCRCGGVMRVKIGTVPHQWAKGKISLDPHFQGSAQEALLNPDRQARLRDSVAARKEGYYGDIK